MTPVVKSLFTDLAMEITSDAMQIHGGYGFTKDQGIEQLYRDNRITPIYEGTNSVQAADLVFRKLSNKNGDIINKFLEMVKSECTSENEKVKPFSKELNHYLDILSKFSDWIKDKTKIEKDDVSSAANDPQDLSTLFRIYRQEMLRHPEGPAADRSGQNTIDGQAVVARPRAPVAVPPHAIA